ncbi:ribonuclease H-like YkuK family protein [Engelhardtia mirabilis]|uniref:Uncharacterized protein n=1 Tax=Engelhardtia mirabilis TaxID=2528011 RepID=A0A518BES2_9BACT|nr:hypothetical protein Pla133_05540 [Planctomycetes bacterium Pla133]QDU99815.1 hypothetical protein Pla86_05540 [Planctomycetes bacterium Pla86]
MADRWRHLSGSWIDDLDSALEELVGDDEFLIHVGTDSKNRGAHTDFVTVVAILRPGFGARVLYRKQRCQRMGALAQRLIQEAQMSIETALMLSERVPQDIVLHIDANPDERHKSSRYARSLAGMGLGNGFEVRLKPDAWCASSVADHVVNRRHQRVA